MKRTQILIFILSVIAALALLCAVFPDGEVKAGPLTLRFPSVTEVLSGAEPEPEKLSPEELLELRRQSVRDAEGDRYEAFFASEPARFYLPGGDLHFFDSLFVALDSARVTPLRIVHYGDSQIEEDRITSTIRTALQERFGGGGQGMLPLRRYFTPAMAVSGDVEPEHIMVYAEKPEGLRKFGPYGDFVRLDTTAKFTFYPVRSRGKGQLYFNRLTVLAGNIEGSLSVSCGGRTLQLDSSASLSRAVFNLPDSSSRAGITLSGRGDIYGVLLDESAGVRMDNVAMRGCSGLVFTSMDSGQLRSFYKSENVRLILLQYGGNTVPYLSKDKAISNYAASVRRQIAHLRGLAPDATFIFIGPSDMSTTVKGKRQTYAHLPALVDSLRAAANDAGAAYWDIYGAMGGSGSMVDWVSATPPLAGSDYVHFTPRGSARVGEMFNDSFLLYYDWYLWRKKNNL